MLHDIFRDPRLDLSRCPVEVGKRYQPFLDLSGDFNNYFFLDLDLLLDLDDNFYLTGDLYLG